MGNKNSSMLQDEEIRIISEETGFSPAQIERLYSRFKSLDKSGICGSLSRQDFLRVPELAINPLCDRIVHMFFVDCDDDHDRINFRQFMKVLAAFRSSAKPTRSRQASRQESIQNILSSLSQNKFRHSRHSSCDGFFNYYPVQHHTTNQHSIHYVASTTHLAQSPFNSIANNLNNDANSHQVVDGNGIVGNYHGLCGMASPTAKASVTGPTGFNGGNQFKKPYPITSSSHHHASRQSLLDLDEPANSRKQKLYFMFKIYDVDNDNRLSLDDLKQILTMMVGNYISSTKLTEITVRTLKQADRNNDGYIDFDEFCTAFLHRDIDELLRVKFSTSCNDITSKTTGVKTKATVPATVKVTATGNASPIGTSTSTHPNARATTLQTTKTTTATTTTTTSSNRDSLKNVLFSNFNNNGPMLTNHTTSAATMSINRVAHGNIFNKARVS